MRQKEPGGRELKALNFIKAELADGRPFPTPIAIGGHCDCTVQTARNALAWLTVHGHLLQTSPPGPGRSAIYELAGDE